MADLLHQVSAQANYLQSVFQEWISQNAGWAQVVYDPDELWGQAAQSSQKPIVYVCFNGEEPWGGEHIKQLTHRVKRKWIVVLKFGRGKQSQRGQALIEGNQNAPAQYNWIEDVRDLVRSTIGLSEVAGIGYQGCVQVKMRGSQMSIWRYDFTTLNDLPQITTTPDIVPSANQ